VFKLDDFKVFLIIEETLSAFTPSLSIIDVVKQLKPYYYKNYFGFSHYSEGILHCSSHHGKPDY